MHDSGTSVYGKELTSMGTRMVRAATLPALALFAATGAAATGTAVAAPAALSRPAGTAAAHARPQAAPGARLWISRLPGGGRTVAVSPRQRPGRRHRQQRQPWRQPGLRHDRLPRL